MRLLLGCVLALTLVSPLHAGFQYSFSFDQPTYNATAGGPAVSLQLRLTETTTGGDTPRLATGGGDGLFQIGLTVNYGTFTGTQSTFLSFTPVAGVGQVNQPIGVGGGVSNTANNVSINFDNQDFLNGLEIGSFGPNSTATAVLGTFVFSNPVGLGSTILTIFDRNPSPGVDDNVFINPDPLSSGTFVIDSVASYGSSIITSAVPEASSFVFAGLTAAVAGVAALRRRFRKKASV